jgi:hypothetical protein
MMDILVYLFSNRLILIEVIDYPINNLLDVLTEQSIIKKSTSNGVFWNNATKYASASDDESFVEEVAYMMVTLHRTGA